MAAINFDVQFVFTGGIDYERRGGITIGSDMPVVEVPYLTEASNVLFEGQQSIRSIGGALVASQTDIFSTVGTKINYPSAMLPVNSAHAGIDFYTIQPLDNTLKAWEVLDDNHVSGDTILLKSTTAIPTTSEDSEWTVIQFEGVDLLMSNTTGELPILWDPLTTSAATWDPAEPDLSLGVVYNNRVFAAGDPLRPSRLYYSDLNDPAAGYAANFISIDPFGGNNIVALKKYRGRLMIFKETSIYVLSGRTPGTFALDSFTDEVGCSNQKAIVDMGNDIAFIDNDGQLRTLATTEQFGDFKNAIVTTPIQRWINDNVQLSQLHRATLYADTSKNRVWMNLPTGPNALDRKTIVMDFSNARKFSFVDYVRARHLVTVKGGSTEAGVTRIIASEANEFLLDLDIIGSERKEDFTGSVLTSSTYKARALSPDVKIMPMFGHNNIQKVSVSLTADSASPTEVVSSSCSLFDPNTSFDLIWQRDIRLFETRSLGQTFGSRLGTFCISGQTGSFLPDDGSVFILGASRLGGPRTIETYAELESFEFRRVAIGFEKESINTGAQLHSITVKFGTSANDSTENILI